MDLAEWKAHANSLLSPAERVKDELRTVIADLKERYPRWLEFNDARWAWFTGAKKVIQTSQLCYIYVRDQLTDPEWWREKAAEFDSIPGHIAEYDVFVRYGFSNMLFTITEETLRSIVRAIDPAACADATAGFQSIYTHLLKVVGKEQHLPLFDFHRLIRNTVHTNGVFRPRNGRNASILLAGKKYDFVVGNKLDFLSFAVLLDLVSQYKAAILDIIETDTIARIHHVERFQW